MTLRIIYRSHGGENRKQRPPFYSKLAALQSFLRAAQAADAEIVFLNDGPVPDDRLSLMRDSGEVVTLDGVGMRGSYVTALRMPARRAWPDSDIVWFSEDDYLYAPQAFLALQAVARQVMADYFAFYGGTSRYLVHADDGEPRWTPPGWDPGPLVEVDGQQWERIVSTASTFGGRVAALRQDLPIFLQGLLPHKNSYRDHDTCVVYQGYQPHAWRQLARDVVGRSGGTPRARAREAALAPFKAALNIRAHRRPAHRRVLLAASPNLATHLEIEWMAPGRDWEAIAADTAAWAARPAASEAH